MLLDCRTSRHKAKKKSVGELDAVKDKKTEVS